MMEAFSAYIKTITAFTLFAAFAEMLMPDTNFKKYISLVLGVLLLTAMLKPFFLILQRGEQGEIVSQFSFRQKEIPIEEEGHYLEQAEERERRLYTIALEKDMEDSLEQVGASGEIDVTLPLDTWREGEISSLTVHCKTGDSDRVRQHLADRYRLSSEDVLILSW